MAGEKIDNARKERLERVAREVVRASAAGEVEADTAAGSPFLYARVRARIEEKRRREEGDGWLALFGVAWRAVPAMALVAVLALALFLSSGANELASANAFGDEEALLGGGGGDIERVVFTDAPTPSNDEVLSTIIGEGESSR